MTQTPISRQDILVSFCLDDWFPGEANQELLVALADKLAALYDYWEIIIAIDRRALDAAQPAVQAVRNLRILGLSGDRHTSYKRRMVAASEAIGDVLVMSSINEALTLDIEQIVDSAHAGNCVIGRWAHRSAPLNPIIRAMGYIAGFRVDTRLLRSVAIPKSMLDSLLQHSATTIALRFPPRNTAFPIVEMPEPVSFGEKPRLGKDLRQNVYLLESLIASAAPQVLQFVTYVSLLTFAVSILFGVYAVIVFLSKETAEGWLTTSLALSGTAAFLAVTATGLSAGLRRVIELLTPLIEEPSTEEISSMQLFNDLRHQINVDISNGDTERVAETADEQRPK